MREFVDIDAFELACEIYGSSEWPKEWMDGPETGEYELSRCLSKFIPRLLKRLEDKNYPKGIMIDGSWSNGARGRAYKVYSEWHEKTVRDGHALRVNGFNAEVSELMKHVVREESK